MSNLLFISRSISSALIRNMHESVLHWMHKFCQCSMFCLWLATARTSSTPSSPLWGSPQVPVLADRWAGKRSSADLESYGLIQTSTITTGILVLSSSRQVLCHNYFLLIAIF